jgi:hypothetical protein
MKGFISEKTKLYRTEWHRKKREEIAKIPSPNKLQCLLCKGWYVQVCSHVYQVHGMTAREYKEYFDLEVKRGLIPEDYRQIKKEAFWNNPTLKNLEEGKKFWYKKGQEGVGKYKRSHVTMERLGKLSTFRKPKK